MPPRALPDAQARQCVGIIPAYSGNNSFGHSGLIRYIFRHHANGDHSNHLGVAGSDQ
jgi:hypothetical protein